MRRFSRSLVAVLLCGAVCVGCRTQSGRTLESSIDSLYRAEQTNDWRTWWSFASPDFKKQMTYEDFIQEWQKDRDVTVVSWGILRIEPMEIPSEERGRGVTAVAKVPMDVTIHRRDKKETEKEKDQTDYWMRMDGRWYWYWRGFPSD